MSKATILVTAANGNTGYPAAKTLLQLGFKVRAFVRNPQNPKARKLKSLGAELYVGDIEDIRDVRNALMGVQRAFFVPVFPNLLFQGETFATACEEMGIEHVVVLTQWLSSNSHPSSYTKEHWLLDQSFKRLANVNVTFVNPGLYAFSYFMILEPIAQLGMMPDFGSNAPPSNEDIGAVVAHILKEPGKHKDKTYRITSREVLTTQKMAEVLAKILGRKIKVSKLPEKMMMKIFKSKGFPVRDYSQLRYYVRDAQNGAFSNGAMTNVVKDIVGREAEDFETIARRYIEGNPLAKQNLFNRIRAIKNMIKAALTSISNLDRYEREMGFPIFKNMSLSSDSKEWEKEHII